MVSELCNCHDMNYIDDVYKFQISNIILQFIQVRDITWMYKMVKVIGNDGYYAKVENTNLLLNALELKFKKKKHSTSSS